MFGKCGQLSLLILQWLESPNFYERLNVSPRLAFDSIAWLLEANKRLPMYLYNFGWLHLHSLHKQACNLFHFRLHLLRSIPMHNNSMTRWQSQHMWGLSEINVDCGESRYAQLLFLFHVHDENHIMYEREREFSLAKSRHCTKGRDETKTK